MFQFWGRLQQLSRSPHKCFVALLNSLKAGLLNFIFLLVEAQKYGIDLPIFNQLIFRTTQNFKLWQ